MDNKLSSLITELVNSQTFSLEGVNAINSLKKKAADLEEDLNRYKKLYEEKVALYAILEKEREVASNLLTEFRAREAELLKREKAITKLECDVEKHMAVSATFKECFGIVFKNNGVKNSVTGVVPIGINSGNGAPGWATSGSLSLTNTSESL